MSADNEQFVTDFCNSLTSGDMSKVVSYLSEDVFYHNMPWAPVNGHAGVQEVLDPFVNPKLLEKMEITHTASSDDVVTNERMETWAKGDVRVLLPVLGVFTITNGKITKWCDYFDSGTLAPLMEALQQS
jgi:limonene-1,2-epoxide hydrolase